MRVFLSVFFILIIGSQSQTYSQVFGLDSSYLIPNKEGYFAERMFELSDSSFLVSYKSKTFHDDKNTFQTLDAFGIYDISKEEIQFTEFPEKINYIGKTGNKLVFSDTRSISTFDLKTLTFGNKLNLVDSSQILHLETNLGELYFYDSLNHKVFSKDLLTGKVRSNFDFDQPFENYFIAISSNEKQICLVLKDKDSSATKIYFLDHFFQLISYSDMNIYPRVPWGRDSETYVKIKPNIGTDNFLFEIIDYTFSGYYKYFEISEAGNKVFDNKGFNHIKELENGLAFIHTPSKWKSLNSNIQIRFETHDFVQIGDDFYALDKLGVRKLKDSLIYLDLFEPKQNYEYLSKFHVLSYETNSVSPPIFTMEGPGYVSNDTVFFEAAGTFKLIGNTVELGTPPQEITINVLKSNPDFRIKSCDHQYFWNLPSDLPLIFQIEIQNPYQSEVEVSIEGGNGTYENGALTIKEFTKSTLNFNIQALENENFMASNVRSCNYNVALPNSDDGSALEIYPNPVNGKTFYVRLSSAERNVIPVLKLYDLNGKEVKFSMFVEDPYNYKIYIAKPLQNIYILKNLSANTSKRLIINN
ncbi:hypothetical protein [uncultured Arcticibacterium sp.]|uniref:hypothetical protein n=1 Tax=uncultured Arcticibacterium sp. TaxID=2173042 RepID=UPI0030FA661F